VAYGARLESGLG